jgi:protein-S-isoprenylcysteine O-methyltransferase Ste14
VFIVLIVEDVIEGIRPHDFTDIRDVKSVIGMGLVAAGMALRSWAAGILHKQSTLTTQGPYALIRNPLHVGSLLLMVGFCVLIDDGENLFFVLGPFLLLLILHVREEEQRLAIRFGASWQNYARMTPRFIPRRLESIRLDGWSFQQWINNSEYRALAATLLGLAGLASWRLLQDGALLPR